MSAEDFIADTFEGILRQELRRTQIRRRLHREYIYTARLNPFIEAQIRMGIYEEATFADEFLGVARTVWDIREDRQYIEYDPVLMARHMEGVGIVAMFGYTRVIAFHEDEHIHQGAISDSTAIEHERRCNEVVRRRVGEQTWSDYEQALRDSATISRVLRRIAQRTKAQRGHG